MSLSNAVSSGRQTSGATKPPAAESPGRGRRSARRKEIRTELATIFMREGFRDLTIDSLAKRLGCSNRTLYTIAPSKEEMFLAVVSDKLERATREGLEGAQIHEDPVARIEAYIRPGVIHSRDLGIKALQDIQSYLPAKALLDRYREERMRGLEEIVASGIESGSFRAVHPHLVAEFLLAGIHRFQQLSLEQKSELPFDQAVEELYDLLLHGVLHT